MAIPHAAPGIPVNLLPQGEVLSEATTNALVKHDSFQAIRLVVPAGHQVCHDHSVEGPITVQCLSGQISFSVDDEKRPVPAGNWVFLPGGVPHTIAGVEDSLILLTILFPAPADAT